METTNFFSNIAALNIKGSLNLTIAKGLENTWVVSVLLNNEQCGDNAKKHIPPLNLKGTIEDLDKSFFEKITEPLQSTSDLLVNMEAFLKQQEEAKKQSAMEKDKADREKKLKEEKKKKYDEAMQKVEELDKEGKHRDAWMKVPDPLEYPEQADTLRKRKSALAAKFAPDLFVEATPTPQNNAPETDDNSLEETDAADDETYTSQTEINKTDY